MKKNYIISVLIWIVCILIGYYVCLPALNFHSAGFWSFLTFNLILLAILLFIGYIRSTRIIIRKKMKLREFPKICIILIGFCAIANICIIVVNFFCSPMFNAKSYANRITIDQTGDFSNDISEVDFNSLPLLDRESSEKLGDRVMGQMSDYVSQYYVSDQYTQINYNNDIIRVTPLDYADFIKWINNRSKGVTGYITVNSVNGETNLVKLDKGMKYTPSAYFNDNIERKLRFSYPTEIFGDYKFEIDNEGNPYWIVPTIGYTSVGLKTRVTGVIIFNPVDGSSKKYDLSEVPEWVDNAYSASLLIEQIDDWGTYNGGFFNSVFSQKNVVATTDGYNYLAMNDDIYMYTGITSVLSDESNLGFVLSNMRTGETVYYSVAGAEEYSAMASAEGQVQQMSYTSTFPLLINLNGKPTYLVSLKDDAGLVKMYGFIDVADYQKVVVTDASKGIEIAANNYLNEYSSEIVEDKLVKENIKVDNITSGVVNGTTYYYIISGKKKYKVSLSLSDNLPFISNGDTLSIGYYKEDSIIKIDKIYE